MSELPCIAPVPCGAARKRDRRGYYSHGTRLARVTRITMVTPLDFASREGHEGVVRPMLQRRGGLDQKMIEGLELTFSNRGVIRWNPF